MTGSSAGSAAAVLVKAFKTRNASIGERSSVPPSGGIMPRNMFRYGSHKVLRERERQRAKTTNRRVRNDIDCLRKGKDSYSENKVMLGMVFLYLYGHFLGEKTPLLVGPWDA